MVKLTLELTEEQYRALREKGTLWGQLNFRPWYFAQTTATNLDVLWKSA